MHYNSAHGVKLTLIFKGAPVFSSRFKHAFFLFIVLQAICSCLQLPVSARAEEVIKIVSTLPRTGSANGQSSSIVNGVRLAIDEQNGRVGNYKIAYEDWDDSSPERGSWDPAVVSTNTNRAISDPQVMAIIGPYNSGAAKIAMPKLNSAGLLMVSPANSAPGLTKPGLGEPSEPMVYRPTGKVTYFRVVPADDIQGYVGAQWAKELGVKKVFVLNDRELYGQGIAEIFRKEATKNGISVVGFEGIDPKASNYRSLAIKIRQFNPDLVYFGGTTQTGAGQIAKDLRSSGLRTKFMVPDGCFENSFIESAGKQNLEGTTYITFGGVPPNKLEGRGHEFYKKYKERFNAEPESYAAYGYEAAKVILDSIARAGKNDRAAIIKAMSETKNFEGVLGTWSFDENGDTTLKTMSGNTVKDGEFAFVKLLGGS